MGKAFLGSLFVFCCNALLFLEILPFTPARCAVTLLLAGLATTGVRVVLLREFGMAAEATFTKAAAYFIAIFLIYSCGTGLLLSWALGRFQPMDVAFNALFMLTFVTAWGLFREARKAIA